MGELNITEILGTGEISSRGRRGAYRKFSPELSAQRREEQKLRDQNARYAAIRALIRLYQEDFDELHKQAKAQVAVELGPLPGD